VNRSAGTERGAVRDTWTCRRLGVTLAALSAFGATHAAAQARPAGANVVLIITDGLRWQELFDGADSALLSAQYGGVEDTLGLRQRFWRSTPQARRAALFPFLWGVVAKEGQLWGNQARGSVAQVTNGFKFSYPGYNEMLTGAPDPRINSNEYGPNPNVTVFEWLNRKPGFAGRVAAFGTWDAFPAIFNRERAGIYLHAAWETPFPRATAPREVLLNELYATTTRIWGDYMSFDALMAAVVREYVGVNRPRALYIGYGETDEWAHDGRYDRVLESAYAVDHFIGELWSAMQRMPEYHGRTTFVISTDHGRGGGLAGWKDHDAKVDGAENIWVAMIGPGVAPIGERSDVPRITQSQIAATLAAAVGEDYTGAVQGVAPAIPTGAEKP
jgi:hypothetical protein